MTPLQIVHEGGQPLVEQIVEQFVTQIQNKSLRPGARLPSIRGFAAEYGVSKFTVVEAYDRLVAQGFVASRRGAGFFVASRPEPKLELRREQPLARVFDSLWLLRTDALALDNNILKVGCGWLPSDWMPEAELEKALRDLARRQKARLTCYGEPFGYLPLRQQLQIRLSELDIEAPPSQILLTQGAMQALDLLSRYLVNEGDVVLVDAPGFFTVFANLKLHGARIVGVPRTPNGPDIVELERLLALHKPKVFLTNSVLHNPTGSSLSPAIAFRILQLAEKYDITIVEDDIYSDFQAGPGERLAALDQLNRVIYVGSFSKTLSANMRVGFIAASPRRIEDICNLKLLTAIASSEAAERVIHTMLTEGSYRKHMDRVKGRLRGAMTRVCTQLEKLGFELWLQPQDGMFVYARHPAVEDSSLMASPALQEGVLLAPGQLFCPNMVRSSWFRFNVAHCDQPAVFEYLGRMVAQASRTGVVRV
ncbi:aminotransferase-like domain-containing protein [Parachitinimonas caeni]|uniref:Putative 8-amino-7-oxononanoate synthase n=1 Tax=Parachitinimonas caeni TaxID=3031301 RepID=A0ABT7E6M9_9NEIS|nr:PLP-dependent aminotransferase family protein [Parachitinimonas caeni]MDK2126567.1 PLP-dependent aminotransferase family protein [Parachitinimonas caeni]